MPHGVQGWALTPARETEQGALPAPAEGTGWASLPAGSSDLPGLLRDRDHRDHREQHSWQQRESRKVRSDRNKPSGEQLSPYHP